MSRTHRSSIRRTPLVDFVNEEALEFHPELVPVDGRLSEAQTRVVLEAVIRAHRWQLVAVARQHLGNDRRYAEDLVQDLCVDVLEGHLPLPGDPTEALVALLREVVERAAT
jgi:DNA-directed RNA polymerase specialized sigma24 family protein